MILQANTGPTSCTRQTFTDSSTTLYYTVRIGGQEVYQDEVTQTINKVAQNDAMNFSGTYQNVSVVMEPGDSSHWRFQFIIGVSARPHAHNGVGSSSTAEVSSWKVSCTNPMRQFTSMRQDEPTYKSNRICHLDLKTYAMKMGDMGSSRQR